MHSLKDFFNFFPKISFLEKKQDNSTGLKFFQIGILLLASAPTISFVFLIFSSILGSIKREGNYFSDRYNLPFISASVLMIINCILVTIGISPQKNLDPSLTWIGLVNWIPFFWCFWGFQSYLRNEKLRISTAKLFIIGSLPVLLSGFTQYFLNWYGPYEIFNKLIIWYQRPISDGSGITGLFNNYNYFGAWLSIILPLSIGLLFKENKNKFLKLIFFIIIIFFIYMITLSTSRNALLTVILTITLLAPVNKFRFEIILLFSVLGICITNLIPFFSINIQNLIYKFIPSTLLDKTSFTSLIDINSFPRVEIWSKAIELIKSNPLIGYGGGSFSNFYNLSNGEFEGMQHTHNIFLEIAFNYGIPSSILINTGMLFILFKSRRRLIFNQGKNFFKINNHLIGIDKAWIISFIVFFFLHIFDITYFDGRISVLAWILLAGMRQIIKASE